MFMTLLCMSGFLTIATSASPITWRSLSNRKVMANHDHCKETGWICEKSINYSSKDLPAVCGSDDFQSIAG